jgi:hypothetical protein
MVKSPCQFVECDFGEMLDAAIFHRTYNPEAEKNSPECGLFSCWNPRSKRGEVSHETDSTSGPEILASIELPKQCQRI